MAVQLTRAERARLQEWLADQDDQDDDDGQLGDDDQGDTPDDDQGDQDDTPDDDTESDDDDVITYRGHQYRRVRTSGRAKTATPAGRKAPAKAPVKATTPARHKAPPVKATAVKATVPADPAPAPTTRRLFT